MSQTVVRIACKAFTLFAFVVSLGASRLCAQLETGSILGTVTDQSNAIVPGAKVTVTNEDTGLSLSTTTSEKGTYVFNPLKIGRYSVAAESPGFATITRPRLRSACNSMSLWTYPRLPVRRNSPSN